MTASTLTTIITASGTRYEVDEALGVPIVRRHASLSGLDALAHEWPDGTCWIAQEVKIVNHPYATMNGGECALFVLTTDGRTVLTSPIMSLTDGVAGWLDQDLDNVNAWQ